MTLRISHSGTTASAWLSEVRIFERACRAASSARGDLLRPPCEGTASIVAACWWYSEVLKQSGGHALLGDGSSCVCQLSERSVQSTRNPSRRRHQRSTHLPSSIERNNVRHHRCRSFARICCFEKFDHLLYEPAELPDFTMRNGQVQDTTDTCRTASVQQDELHRVQAEEVHLRSCAAPISSWSLTAFITSRARRRASFSA